MSAATEMTKTKTLSGIPEAQFVEDVAGHLSSSGGTITEAMQKQDELLAKYKMLLENIRVQQARLKTQIPDIKNCLRIIGEMRTRKASEESLSTRYLLSDQVYVQATVPPTDKVCLWLGANVMLEYDLDSAEELLSTNLSKAEQKLEGALVDIDFLRAQITTTEVTIARLHNHQVQLRRQAQTKA